MSDGIFFFFYSNKNLKVILNQLVSYKFDSGPGHHHDIAVIVSATSLKWFFYWLSFPDSSMKQSICITIIEDYMSM